MFRTSPITQRRVSAISARRFAAASGRTFRRQSVSAMNQPSSAADPDASGLEQLTASERRVAELAAEGRSNPEIAQALFVTRKTVETHVNAIFGKLGLQPTTDDNRRVRAVLTWLQTR